MDYVAQITSLRNSKIHISGVMLMGIIHKIKKRDGVAYLGEIYEYYEEYSGRNLAYTEAGMRTQLWRLQNRGYVKIQREGRYCTYMLTHKGIVTMEGFAK